MIQEGRCERIELGKARATVAAIEAGICPGPK